MSMNFHPFILAIENFTIWKSFKIWYYFNFSGCVNELPKNNQLNPNNLIVPFLSARLPPLSTEVTYVNFLHFSAAFAVLRRLLTMVKSWELRRDFEVNRDADRIQVSTFVDVQKQVTLVAKRAWISQSRFLC